VHLREREAAATQYCLSQPSNTLLMAAARGSPRSWNGLAERGRDEGAPSEEGSGVDPVPTPPCPPPRWGPPLPAGEEAGRLRAPRRLARPRPQGSADASWAVFFMRGAGQLGVGTEVEMVGDVANRMEKLEAAIGHKPNRVPGLTRVCNGLFHI